MYLAFSLVVLILAVIFYKFYYFNLINNDLNFKIKFLNVLTKDDTLNIDVHCKKYKNLFLEIVIFVMNFILNSKLKNKYFKLVKLENLKH